jgi:CRP-like cAMP-binding protein/predicted GNAT family N-acyltransferase
MTGSEFQVSRIMGEADREQLYRLRYDIFTKEQSKYVAIADHGRKMLVDALDPVAEHFAVSHQGDLVASLRILYGADKATPAMIQNLSLDKFGHLVPEHVAFCGRLFVLPAYRRSAALFALVQHCYRASRERGARIDFIFCNPHLVRMYEQLGYRRYRPYFEDPNLGFQIPLVLITGDTDHFKTVRSPLNMIARKLPPDTDLSDWFEQAFPEYRSFVSPLTVGATRFMEIMSGKISQDDKGLMYGFDEAERNALVAATTHLEVAAGTKLIRKGDLGKELFLILQGVAEVRSPKEDGNLLLATLGQGDVFGEMSLLTSRPRSADVIAQTEIEVIFLDDDSLNKLVKVQPALAAKLLQNLCRTLAERLETTSSQLASASLSASSSSP